MGLEVSLIALSKVKGDNDKSRIDSRYFGRAAVDLSKRLSALPHERFGAIASTFRKGIFDIKADTYVDEGGIPFVRVGDLRSGMIDRGSLAQISEAAHQAESKTALTLGDIVLAKTAYPAAAVVTIAECNASQDTVAVRLSAAGKQRFRSGFIVAYLNSVVGRTLMGRLFQGNVQEHLGLSEAADMAIPQFGLAFQESVDRAFWRAHEQRLHADACMARAEALLLNAFGLHDWSPPEPLTYTQSATQASLAGRIDAEFAAPKVQALLRRLGEGGATLRDYATVRRTKFKPAPSGDFTYIEIGDLDGFGRAAGSIVAMAEAPSRATWHVRAGDVITSTVRPIRRLSAIVSSDQNNHVCSSGFVVLHPNGINPESLVTYLRLPLICRLLDLFATASMYPALSESDLMSLPMPRITEDIDKAVTDTVRRSRRLLHASERLLGAAKRAVEIAIEQDEITALTYIDEQREAADAAPF